MFDLDCSCSEPPFSHSDFESRSVGIDETGGRFAEVSVEVCKSCGQEWLHYFYEYEAISGSGRWYRAMISHDEAAGVTSATAVQLLGRRNWHFRGGSYFQTTGQRCDWKIDPGAL